MSIPSPEMPSYLETLRDNPYLVTLDRAFRHKCREAEDLEHEVELLRAQVATQKVTIARLRNSLSDARRRLDLWRERHRTWQRERAELVGSRR